MLFHEDFEFQDIESTTPMSSRLTIHPRDIRRLQRFSHLTKMNTMSISYIAGEMYKISNKYNQITDLNYSEWVDEFINIHLSKLPGEIKWCKSCFLSLFQILDRDHLHYIELSDIITSMTVFTKNVDSSSSLSLLNKFQVAFQLYGK